MASAEGFAVNGSGKGLRAVESANGTAIDWYCTGDGGVDPGEDFAAVCLPRLEPSGQWKGKAE